MLEPEQLRDIDRELLKYLRERAVTPAYCRQRLIQDGFDEYSRGYVQQRLARFEEHGHAENLLDTGLYELVDDPEADIGSQPVSDEETEGQSHTDDALACPDCGESFDSFDELRQHIDETDPDH